MKKQSFEYFELALYYVVIFFILQEWLLPIMELTKTGHMNLILGFIALALVISLFQIHFAISWGIKAAYIVWFIVSIHSDYTALSLNGLQFLFSDIQFNIMVLFQREWSQVTDPFRTLLFFILIWMLIYLVHHWITARLTIFSFLVLTVFFIAILDTFTEYDGSFAIVKITILGLVMTSFLYLKRLLMQSGVVIEWYKYLKLLIPVIFLIGLVSVVAIALPKPEPQWPDPVPFIKSATGQGGLEQGSRVSKVGYDENDSQLGGPFVADDSVIFYAVATAKQYWRVETKDFYTSKGWGNTTVASQTLYSPNDTIQHSLPIGPSKDTTTASINMTYPYEFIVQPYGLKTVQIDEQSYPNITLRVNNETEKIIPYQENNPLSLTSYNVEYSKPNYLYSELQKSSTYEAEPLMKERYLQLPESLPRRVVELAESIVAGQESPYLAAREIEGYFKQNAFRYDTKDVAIPAEEQDYVDQFLFESKVGYCDNFSTSMVVLLRSVGIPARWIKGFAGGEMVDSNGDMRTFEVTNNNAHSWVEAYIPNVGWVNFEPTIGFSNTRAIEYDIETETEKEENLVVNEDTKPKAENKQQKDVRNKDVQTKTNIFTKQNLWIFALLLLLLLILGVVGYRQRRKWLPKVYLKLNKNRQLNEASFEISFNQMLKILELKGVKRKDGETLAAFAKEVDARFNTEHMSKITRAYELYIYGNDSAEIDFAKVRESWEYLIKCATS